jgi:hypothetical protein
VSYLRLLASVTAAVSRVVVVLVGSSSSRTTSTNSSIVVTAVALQLRTAVLIAAVSACCNAVRVTDEVAVLHRVVPLVATTCARNVQYKQVPAEQRSGSVIITAACAVMTALLLELAVLALVMVLHAA